jgi:hypothetical protein
MKKTVVVPLVAILTAAAWQESAEAAGKSAAAGSGSTEATIMQLDDKVRGAALKADVATIQDMFADDYVSISAVTGTTTTKADAVNNYKSGKLKYESIDATDVKVHVYGPTTALVTGKADVKGKLGDQDISGSYRFSRLYVKRGGKWQVVAFQSTKIPAQVRTG